MARPPLRLGRRLLCARLIHHWFGRRRIDIPTFFAHFGSLYGLALLMAWLQMRTALLALGWLLPLFILPHAVARLHDSGRSGWWAIVPAGWAGAAFQLVRLLPGLHAGVKMAALAVMIGWLGAALWLMLQAGDVGRNRYGPDPQRGRI